jgi:hypothetical protein
MKPKVALQHIQDGMVNDNAEYNRGELRRLRALYPPTAPTVDDIELDTTTIHDDNACNE